MGRIAGVPN